MIWPTSAVSILYNLSCLWASMCEGTSEIENTERRLRRWTFYVSSLLRNYNILELPKFHELER